MAALLTTQLGIRVLVFAFMSRLVSRSASCGQIVRNKFLRIIQKCLEESVTGDGNEFMNICGMLSHRIFVGERQVSEWKASNIYKLK